MRHARELRVVDAVGAVAWSVVVVVQVGGVHQRRDVHARIRHVVTPEVPPLGVCRPVPERVEDEPTGECVRAERHRDEIRRIAMRGLRAEERGRVGMVPPDHVAVQYRGDLCERHDRVRGVVSRTQKSALLRAVMDEEHRAFPWLSHEGPRRGEYGGADGRVVIGTRVHRVPFQCETHTVRILVRAEHHVFVAEHGIGAADDADDVHRRRGEPFQPQRELGLWLARQRLTHCCAHEDGGRRATPKHGHGRDAIRAVCHARHRAIHVVGATHAHRGYCLERAVHRRVRHQQDDCRASACKVRDGAGDRRIGVADRKRIAGRTDGRRCRREQRGRDDPTTNVGRGVRRVRNPQHRSGGLGGHDTVRDDIAE